MLDDRYKMGLKLASGAMGVLYRAQHVRLERPVAIKIVDGEHIVGGPEEVRLLREGRIGARIAHPSVCAVLDLGVMDDAAPYLVMELLEGESAKARLARMGRIHANEALRIARSMAEALASVHRLGFVHRDLKPSNVFLARDGDREIAKLIDFGLASEIGGADERAERGRVIVGTLPYMAPEVLIGRPASPRSDLWSLGVTLYELLAGRLPFPHDAKADHREFVKRVLRQPALRPSDVRSDVPEEADRIVEMLLEKVPEQRADHAQLVDAIDDAIVAIEIIIEEAEPTFASGGHRA